MLSRYRERRAPDESGVSLIEVMVAGAMASIIATAFIVVFSSFSRSVALEESRAAALAEVQSAAADLTAELRQAIPLVTGEPIVALLDSSWGNAELIFHSDRAQDAPGPERYRYYLDSCVDNRCNLMRDITVADSAAAPWTFSGTPGTRLVITNLLTDGDPLFSGIDWSTGARVVTTDCDAASPCDFSLVEIVIRVDPDPNLAAEEALHVRHEVRMRNAR